MMRTISVLKKSPRSALSFLPPRHLVALLIVLWMSFITTSLASEAPEKILSVQDRIAALSDQPNARIKIPHPEGIAWTDEQTQQGEKHSRFPYPLPLYPEKEEQRSLWEKLGARLDFDDFNFWASLCFLGAIIHTFVAPYFIKLAHYFEREGAQHHIVQHIAHLLGEIELVFVLWIVPFALVCLNFYTAHDFWDYLVYDCNYTEPLFVATIMIIAASRPIYSLAEGALQRIARLGGETPLAWWLTVLTVAPFFGSFITEPAAMTLAAIILSHKIYGLKPSKTFCYATLALLFVNVSVGGTLTHFAAPPIVMVATTWEWDLGFMMVHFGWKAMLGIVISNAIYLFLFRKEFARLAECQSQQQLLVTAAPSGDDDAAAQATQAATDSSAPSETAIPLWVYAVSIALLVFTVYFAHYPLIFLAGLGVFIAFYYVTKKHHDGLVLKVPILVGAFLAGLLVLGGVQGWWMQPVLQALAELGEAPTMSVASILTAFNDNAAVTYLASTVPNLPADMKYAIVAGAVTGGGLTVIANAPNLAGQSILSKHFDGINALMLAFWALLPTVVMFCMFYLL